MTGRPAGAADEARTSALYAGEQRQDAPAAVLGALSLVRHGSIYRLARTRFPGMPLFPGHPPLSVTPYRTPHGMRVAGDDPWGPPNDIGLGYISEMVLATTHSGAHIDALAHMTVQRDGDDHWRGGSASVDLGDFGPRRGDAAELPVLWTRGVLFDVPRYRGVEYLGRGEPVTADELQAVASSQRVELQPGDVALIRSGYMSHWPDPERLDANRGPGPDISAARWLVEQGVIATGSDTETYEVQPAPDRGTPSNPQPVHTLLLNDHGIYILESLDLEQLAADAIFEFLFVALPLKIAGATGSMIDPIAVT
jgi:kynurenine formamidase